MGEHRKAKPAAAVSPILPPDLPEWPDNKGKRKRITNIFGETRHLIIQDEIRRLQSSFPNKLIVFQRLEIEEDKVIEFRLGYYMIGVKPGAKGRWVWGQFCLMIPKEDLEVIMQEAEKLKWFRGAAGK